jgi:hypothetical protein
MTESFIKRAKEVHGDVYDYSKVEYTLMNNKVCIICKEHGEFMQSAAKHVLTKRGCPTCGIKKCAKAITVPWEDFVNRARKKHGDKFQYIEESYNGMNKRMDIICPEHEKITMTASSHCITKTGCKFCGNTSKAFNKSRSYEEFIKRANEVHKFKYDYSKTLYINGHKKITIICPIHGEFQQTASKHLSGGCRKCADDLHASKMRKTTEEYIEQARKVYGDLYDYSKVYYKNSNNKILINCKIHGDFYKIARDHLNGQGCQKCKPPKHSKFAISWLKYRMVCDNVHIEHAENGGEHRIKNSLYHADGYCKETNTVWEALGSYWHGSPKIYDPNKRNKHNGKTFGELYQNTLKKREHCIQNGYNVIEVWEWEWKKGIWAVKQLQRAFRKASKI